MRKSCVFYAEWADQIINLPPELAGALVKAILKYAIYGEDEDTGNPALNAMLVPIKKRLDEDEKAWEEAKRQRSEGGKKGMAKRWHKEVITEDNSLIDSNKSDTEDITPITVNVNVNGNKEKKYKKKKAGFGNFPERTYDYAALMEETGNV